MNHERPAPLITAALVAWALAQLALLGFALAPQGMLAPFVMAAAGCGVAGAAVATWALKPRTSVVWVWAACAALACICGAVLTTDAPRGPWLHVTAAAWIAAGFTAARGALELGRARREPGRATWAMSSMLSVTLAGAWLAGAYALSAHHDVFTKLGRGMVPPPSAATHAFVAGLKRPVRVTLYFRTGSPVHDELASYFQALEAHDTVHVAQLDRDLAPAQAAVDRVSSNGVIVLRAEGQPVERVRVGEKLGPARKTLRQLDTAVHDALTRLDAGRRVLYVLHGHDERTLRRDKGRDGRSGLTKLKTRAEKLGFAVKTLGVSGGLARGVPADADVVLLADPRTAMLPAETAALTAYVRSGGALFALGDPVLDPAARATAPDALTGVLGAFGVQIVRAPLVHTTQHASVARTDGDRLYLFSTRLGRHASVRALRALGRAGLVLLPVGGHVTHTASPDATCEMTVGAPDGAFVDLDGNLALGEAERAGLYDAALACTTASGGRLAVVADTDVLTDAFLDSAQGNQQFVDDTLRWLVGDAATGAAARPAEDVRLTLTAAEESALFAWSTWRIPGLLVLWAAWRAWRKRRPKAAPAPAEAP